MNTIQTLCGIGIFFLFSIIILSVDDVFAQNYVQPPPRDGDQPSQLQNNNQVQTPLDLDVDTSALENMQSKNFFENFFNWLTKYFDNDADLNDKIIDEITSDTGSTPLSDSSSPGIPPPPPGSTVIGETSSTTSLSDDSSVYTDENGNTVTISGGHETDVVDGGRPVYLIGAILGITGEQFRNAFSYVTPEENGHLNEETARANKAKLLAQLEPYGIINDEIDEATNYYRYPPRSTEIWPYTHAVLTATVENGSVTGFEIVSGGNGYTSEPTITVEGYGAISVDITISYTNTFSTNGAIITITEDMMEKQITESNQVVEFDENESSIIETSSVITGECPIENFLDVSSYDGAGSSYPKPSLNVYCDEEFVYVESNGIPHYSFVQTTPNALSAQDYLWEVPLNPKTTSQTFEIPLLGLIGFAVNGLPIYGPNEGPFPDPYGDPVHNAILDNCLGHTAQRGDYHYHAFELSCLTLDTGNYQILGYALDGFPIYGPYGCIDGDCTNVVEFKSSWIQTGDPTTYAWDNHEYVSNDDPAYLDECNGRYDEQLGYHYRATENFPYLLGCYMGEVSDSVNPSSEFENNNQGGPPQGGPNGIPEGCPLPGDPPPQGGLPEGCPLPRFPPPPR